MIYLPHINNSLDKLMLWGSFLGSKIELNSSYEGNTLFRLTDITLDFNNLDASVVLLEDFERNMCFSFNGLGLFVDTYFPHEYESGSAISPGGH